MRRGRGRPGLLGMAARTAVVAGTATAVSGRVQNRQMNAREQEAEAAAYEQQQQVAQMAPAPAPVAAAPQEDVFEQLAKFGKLHEQGILTDEEFAAQKAKLLA